MSLRTRLLLAFAVVVLIPIALLAFGLRQEMARRLSQEYQLRVDQVVEVIREDLARESAGIAERLASLESALAQRQPVSSRRPLPASSRNGSICSTTPARRCASPACRCSRFRMATAGSSAPATSGTSMAASRPGWHRRWPARAAPAFVTTRGAEREFLALARVRVVPDRRPDVHHRRRRCRGRSVSRAAGPRSRDRRVARAIQAEGCRRSAASTRRTGTRGHDGRCRRRRARRFR